MNPTGNNTEFLPLKIDITKLRKYIVPYFSFVNETMNKEE